jgi:SAM-dependent methyltransferase
MLAQTEAQIVAVDISPDLLEKAKDRKLPFPRIQFLEKRFEDCEMDGPFDAIVGSSILHHLDLEPALAKIYHLLRPGGVVSFAEPNMLNPQIYMERHFRNLFPNVSPDETAFLRWRIGRILADSGFKEISVTPFDWLHPVTPVRLIHWVSDVGELLERIPFLCEFAGSLSIHAVRP